MQLLFWDKEWCHVSLLISLLWKWSSVIQRLLQSLCSSAVIKQGASGVKTSWWLLHTGSSQNRTSGVPVQISAITCMEREGPNMLLSVLCLQKVLGHSSYILIMNTQPFWSLQQDKFHLLQIPEKINVEDKYYKIVTFQVVSVHIRVVFLRVARILRTLLLLFTTWELFLIRSPQISNACI